VGHVWKVLVWNRTQVCTSGGLRESTLQRSQWSLLRRDAGRAGGFALGGRLHLEKHVFEAARLVEAHQVLGVGFDLAW